MKNENYYKILGVRQTASPEEITAAKNKLAKKFHPDATAKNGLDTTDEMAKILEAYATLSDPEKREAYDRSLAGRGAEMQTFDLYETADAPQEDTAPILTCWRAANDLYDIVQTSLPLLKQDAHHPADRVKQPDTKYAGENLTMLTLHALEQIHVLREEKIPQQYWHPDTMNWLLFSHMKNRNYTIDYLMTLYDVHLKKDLSAVKRQSTKRSTTQYLHDLNRLLTH